MTERGHGKGRQRIREKRTIGVLRAKVLKPKGTPTKKKSPSSQKKRSQDSSADGLQVRGKA